MKSPDFDWNEMLPSEHFVQFYETDAYLVESVSAFIANALMSGAGGMVVATDDHRREIERGLSERGVDVAAAASRGQYVALDARETVSRLFRDGAVNADRFEELVAGPLSDLTRNWPGARVFGELVALLYQDRHREAACQLEELWNELQKRETFALFCAYPLRDFNSGEDCQPFANVCGCHSRVLPAESYTSLSTREEQLREISALQQKARALEAEVAQRRRAEDELTDFVENALEGLHKVGPDGRIIWANRAELEMLGYSEDEYVGRHIAEFHVDQDLIREILTELLRGGKVLNCPAELRCKDGSTKHVLIHSNGCYENGKLVYTRCFTRDVTDRKRAETSLRDSEERYRSLAELLPVGVYTCEAPTGRVTYYNAQAAKLWGNAPDLDKVDVRFCGSLKLFLPNGTELPHDQCPMAVALSEGQAFRNEEVIMRRADGSEVTALVNIDPIRDSSGKIVGAVNVFNDMTSLKEIERELREQKENLQTLLDTLPIGVFIAHDVACRRISGNHAATELLRMPPGSNLSTTAPSGQQPTHFSVFQHGQPVRPEDSPLQRAARGESVRGEELEHRFEDGVAMHTIASAQPLFDTDGRPRGAVGTVLDITKVKIAENALREADRRKDEFLATLAHELRNPLAPIRTGLELMKLANGDLQLIEETRDAMERQTLQLITLVDDLLDVSRITRGKFELRKSRVELSEITRSAVEAARPFIDEAGHQLTVELPKEPLYVNGDPNRLTQVLSNLLNNAAKYTPNHGRIWLTVDRQGDEVAIAVKDTGIGIPPEMSERIFEMFAQVHHAHETSYSGLGIGLTLVKSLVAMHGGSVEARSPGIGQGSVFTVRLPISANPPGMEAARIRGSATTDAKGPLRVLVVDDNEAAATTLSMVIKMFGHEVATAGDGAQAIDVAERFLPQLVLMDIGMPEMNGYEAARHMRKQPWGQSIMLVALTGWGQDEDKRKTMEAGFNHHLVKPADPALLQQLLADFEPSFA